MCMYIYIYIYTHMHIRFICICMCLHICGCVYIYIYTHTYIYIYIYIYICNGPQPVVGLGLIGFRVGFGFRQHNHLNCLLLRLLDKIRHPPMTESPQLRVLCNIVTSSSIVTWCHYAEHCTTLRWLRVAFSSLLLRLLGRGSLFLVSGGSWEPVVGSGCAASA